jgi:hypothetical protein
MPAAAQTYASLAALYEGAARAELRAPPARRLHARVRQRRAAERAALDEAPLRKGSPQGGAHAPAMGARPIHPAAPRAAAHRPRQRPSLRRDQCPPLGLSRWPELNIADEAAGEQLTGCVEADFRYHLTQLLERPIRDNKECSVRPQFSQEWAVARQQDPVLVAGPLDESRIVGRWIVGSVPSEHAQPAG